MLTSNTIIARPRTPGNKGDARKLRATGWVPAIAYGPSIDPRPLAVDPKIFETARKKYGASFIYQVDVEGEQGFKALIKRLQRDALTSRLTHVDFYAVDMEKPIRVMVRLELVGKAIGLKEGGLLQQVRRRIEVLCLPGDMPEKITYDVTEMDIGDVVHLSDLTLPESVRSPALEDYTVVILTAPAAEEEEEPTEELLPGEEGAVPAEEGESEESDEEKKEKKEKKE